MVTDLRCWNYYVGDFFHYLGDFSNVFNRHQSVTNINVTSERGEYGLKYHLVKVIWMDEDDTVNHYEANYQFIFTWSMIRLGFFLNLTLFHGPWRSGIDRTLPF